MAKYNKVGRYHNPWTNLAAAILASGERCKDTYFLESDWAEELREMCRLDDELYGDRCVRATRGVIDFDVMRRNK